MDKNENRKQNMVEDEELDQVAGGGFIFDVMTTEFRGEFKEPTSLYMYEEDETVQTFGLNTLEMRTNPLEKKTGKKTKKVMKI